MVAQPPRASPPATERNRMRRDMTGLRERIPMHLFDHTAWMEIAKAPHEDADVFRRRFGKSVTQGQVFDGQLVYSRCQVGTFGCSAQIKIAWALGMAAHDSDPREFALQAQLCSRQGIAWWVARPQRGQQRADAEREKHRDGQCDAQHLRGGARNAERAEQPALCEGIETYNGLTPPAVDHVHPVAPGHQTA